MIVFDLRCTVGHVFESWFGSSASFEEQKAKALIACPICGDAKVEKAVMAPNVGAKGNQSPSVTPDAFKAALEALASAQAKVLENSTWVGSSFASKARSMHLGDEPEAAIHGQTTVEEAKALIDEGVPIAPLPLPVIPPEACN